MADDKRPQPDHGLPGKPGDRPDRPPRPDHGLPGKPGDRPAQPEQLPVEPEAEPKRG
jgi:hypothetical protein